MGWFFALLIVMSIAVFAVIAYGRWEMPKTDEDRYRAHLDRCDRASIEALRFPVVIRGYHMGQVDEVIEKLIQRIEDLESRCVNDSDIDRGDPIDAICACEDSDSSQLCGKISENCADQS